MPSMINGISDYRSTSNTRDARVYQTSDLKKESLGIKQFTSDRYKHICKYMQEYEKYNLSVFNLLSCWYHKIGYAHCQE